MEIEPQAVYAWEPNKSNGSTVARTGRLRRARVRNALRSERVENALRKTKSERVEKKRKAKVGTTGNERKGKRKRKGMKKERESKIKEKGKEMLMRHERVEDQCILNAL